MKDTTLVSSIIWETERVLAVGKAAGVSLATSARAPGEAVRRLVASLPPEERAALPFDPECLLLVHRLDIGTSGLVLLAKDPEAHAHLVRAFSERLVQKSYLALVWGQPRPKEGRWDWPLGPDRKDRRRMRVNPAGKASASGYRVLETSRYVSLLQLHPETGRTHQLRVHCSHAGHLIVGDDLYGGPCQRRIRDRAVRDCLSPRHLLLHAWSLHLPQTRATQEVILRAPIPQEFGGVLDFLGFPHPDTPPD